MYMGLGILDGLVGAIGVVTIVVFALILLFLLAVKVLPPWALLWLDRVIDRPAPSMLLSYFGVRKPIKEQLKRVEFPPEEAYRRVWGFEEGDDVYLIMPEQRSVRSDGGTDESIDVDALSFPTDELVQGETYAVRVTPRKVERDGKGVILHFFDADGEPKDVTLFSNSASHLTNRSFEKGTEYVLTDVRYNCKQSGNETYHNLRATRHSTIREAGSDIGMGTPSRKEPRAGQTFTELNEISFADHEFNSGSRYDVRVQPHTVKRYDDRQLLFYNDSNGETRNVCIWDKSDLYGIEYNEGDTYRFANAKYERNESNGVVYHDMLVDEHTKLREGETDEVQPQRERYPMFKAVVHVYGGLMNLYDGLNIKVMTDSEFQSAADVQNGNLVFIGTKELLDDLNVEHGLRLERQSDRHVIWMDGHKDDLRPKNHHDRSDLADGGGISKRINPNNRSRSQIVVTGTSNKGVIGASKALVSSNPDTDDESFDNCQYVLNATGTDSSNGATSPHFDVVFDVNTRHGDPEIPTLDREPIAIRDR